MDKYGTQYLNFEHNIHLNIIEHKPANNQIPPIFRTGTCRRPLQSAAQGKGAATA